MMFNMIFKYLNIKACIDSLLFLGNYKTKANKQIKCKVQN